MSLYRQQVRSSIEATEFLSPSSYSWFGKPTPPLPPATAKAMSADALRAYLIFSLQSRLYADFYSRGKAVAISPNDPPLSPRPVRTPFIESLSAANAGRGQWQSGWIVQSVQNNVVLVQRNGLAMRTTAESCQRPPNLPLRAGIPVRIRSDRESLGASPAFYVAFSNAELPNDGQHPLVRFYWNLTPEGAVPLMREVTTNMNKLGLRFQIKVLNDEARYSRCDAGVLYVPKTDFVPVARALALIYPKVAPFLKPGTPAFTKVLADGLGLAEDPGGNTSFGMHRCELLAGLLCHSAGIGLKTTDEKLAFIDEALRSAGYSLDTPYLNPGSSDHYQILFPQAEPRMQVAAAEISPGTDPAPPSAEESLAMAVTLGRKLTDSAIWYEDRCNWLASTVDGSILSYGATGPDLYSGLTGIGWFLAELAAVTGGEVERHAALAALRNALTIADNMLHPIPFDALYSGPIGFALISLRAGALLADDTLVAQARALISRRPQLAAQKLPDFDMMAGFAGTIAGLVILAELVGDRTLLETATELGDALIAHGEQSHGRCSWKSPYMAKFRNLTGFSHGAAGGAFALLELFDVTREDRFRTAAESAFAYERYWFDERTQNWPDFRGVPASVKKSDITFSSETAWCHGAPGIALSRLRAYELLDVPAYKAEAEVALRTTLRSTEGMLASGVGNYSLCHGMTGNAEILRYGARLLGGEWRSIWADLNGRIAAAGIATHGSGRLPWRSGGPVEGPGLMVGLAGIGYYYLRQSKPAIPSPLLLLRHEFAPVELALRQEKVGARRK